MSTSRALDLLFMAAVPEHKPLTEHQLMVSRILVDRSNFPKLIESVQGAFDTENVAGIADQGRILRLLLTIMGRCGLYELMAKGFGGLHILSPRID